MALGKSEPRRKFHLVVAALINALGGYKAVAAYCMTTPSNVNKWKLDPEDDGQMIPLIHLLNLFSMCGAQLTNLAAQNALDELICDHILSRCFRRAYLEERVFEFVELLTNGSVPRRAVNE